MHRNITIKYNIIIILDDKKTSKSKKPTKGDKDKDKNKDKGKDGDRRKEKEAEAESKKSKKGKTKNGKVISIHFLWIKINKLWNVLLSTEGERGWLE